MQLGTCHAKCSLTLALLAVSALANCSNANLTCISAGCKPDEPSAADNKMAFTGTACTAAPDSVGYPYKILFIVDVSGSTVTSDPTNNRGPAVQAVLQQYASNPEVSFAIISFDSQPNILEPTFTRDLNILLPIVPQLNANRGTTNYLDTLAQAANIIATDANTMTATERSRTRYDVEWLSDGVPDPCVDTNTILGVEEKILDLANTEGLFSVKLSTVFLTGAFGGGCSNTPDQIMQPMAAEGGGTFLQLTGPNIKFKIDFANILQPFSKQYFYLVNESRVVKNNTLYPDSDRDGVSDPDEANQKTDPTIPDTGGTGCGDRINQLESLNPNLCAAICAKAMSGGNVTLNANTLPDTDADEIHDCAESSLGIQREKADTDGDNLLDPLEIRFGTNAGDASTLVVDSDLDSVLDVDEIFGGTDPLTPEPNRDLAYVYQPLTSAPSSVNGESCFKFDVSNVQLVQTIATPTSNAGDNVICMYIEQLPQGNSAGNSEPTVSRGCFTANYTVVNGHSLKVPESGLVELGPADFKPYICGSEPCVNDPNNTGAPMNPNAGP